MIGRRGFDVKKRKHDGKKKLIQPRWIGSSTHLFVTAGKICGVVVVFHGGNVDDVVRAVVVVWVCDKEAVSLALGVVGAGCCCGFVHFGELARSLEEALDTLAGNAMTDPNPMRSGAFRYMWVTKFHFVGLAS